MCSDEGCRIAAEISALLLKQSIHGYNKKATENQCQMSRPKLLICYHINLYRSSSSLWLQPSEVADWYMLMCCVANTCMHAYMSRTYGGVLCVYWCRCVCYNCFCMYNLCCTCTSTVDNVHAHSSTCVLYTVLVPAQCELHFTFYKYIYVGCTDYIPLAWMVMCM